MITADEIKRKAIKAYLEVLKANITGVAYFPLNLRSDKSLSKNFVEMSSEIALVMAESKDRKGYGYTIYSETIKSRLHGNQDIPKSIEFETLFDYLKFIGKTTEFQRFQQDCELILTKIPTLNNWIIENPFAVISNSDNWADLIKVCHWFLNHHEAGKFYIRELPVDVHTKFVETNMGILKNLLDILIPDKVNIEERSFEKRFGLKYAEPRIRIRFLDDKLLIENRFKDLSIPLHEFAAANFDCIKIIITENKMNFLTLPQQGDTIAIWGGGFAVSNLKDVEWLKGKQIFYWGDIDEHGFQILHQLRSYYPNVQSIMMDWETFEAFKDFAVNGSRNKSEYLSLLTREESKIFAALKSLNCKNRLEQEKIPQVYVDYYLKKTIN